MGPHQINFHARTCGSGPVHKSDLSLSISGPPGTSRGGVGGRVRYGPEGDFRTLAWGSNLKPDPARGTIDIGPSILFDIRPKLPAPKPRCFAIWPNPALEPETERSP